MRWIGTLVTALLFSSHIQAAEQKPWKCVTEKSLGAKTTDGEIQSTGFKDRTEFRIKPLGVWTDDLTGNDLFETILQVSIDSASEAASVGVSLIRKVSEDPKKYSSWGACKVNEVSASDEKPAYNLVFCDQALVIGAELRFDTSTGRFTSVAWGDWHNTAKGETPTSDSWFDFGTCTPYYD